MPVSSSSIAFHVGRSIFIGAVGLEPLAIHIHRFHDDFPAGMDNWRDSASSSGDQADPERAGGAVLVPQAYMRHGNTPSISGVGNWNLPPQPVGAPQPQEIARG